MHVAGIDQDGVVFTPVSPKLTTVKLTASTIGHLIGLAVLGVPLLLQRLGVWPDFWTWAAWGLPALVLVSWVTDLVLIPRRVRAMGWAEREDDLLWRQGVLIRTLNAVPYGRLQYVDTSDGPLLRRHGLQTLALKTAASGADVELQGLPAATCDELREVLMARGQARLAGL
ncbi:PH domain-containing protein [Micrococcus sp. M4NT]|uniref:PH domain-containing protein n=1 Tax=Micrococcus sp. M4NT TaxID=2957501 RepID=UPI0029BD9E26|nr:PH domain-containing protein [Micrococcus sp. M4NT]MDX2341557.1 PH domain-containing protein [Micrococcus sp. M4NT]